MTIQEQIAQERDAIARLSAQLSRNCKELAAAEESREHTMESSFALSQARLGVSSVRRLLKAHEDSLALILARAEKETTGGTHVPPLK